MPYATPENGIIQGEPIPSQNSSSSDEELVHTRILTPRDSSAPQTHTLVGTESLNIASIVTALNSTSTLGAYFANNGEDLVETIEYNPEWWCMWSERLDPYSMTLENWQLQVRIELQKLNAFLAHGTLRKSCTTGRLESLLRCKAEDPSAKEFSLTEACSILAKIPQFNAVLTQKAFIEGVHVNILPLPVELEDIDHKNSGVQAALDSMFWSTAMSTSEKFEVAEIPVLETLNDIFMVQCEPTITLDKEIWPERYTDKYIPIIEKYWNRKQEIERSINNKKKELGKLMLHNDLPVVRSVQSSLASLTEAGGQELAMEELEKVLDDLKMGIDAGRAELSKNKALLDRHMESAIVPINPMMLTPWRIKTILWIEEADGPICAVLVDQRWVLIRGGSHEDVEWDDVVSFAKSRNDFMVIYEREHNYFRSDKKCNESNSEFAPSIQQFIKVDNERVNESTGSNDREKVDVEDRSEVEEDSDEGKPDAKRRV